jgi:hypothetical protein
MPKVGTKAFSSLAVEILYRVKVIDRAGSTFASERKVVFMAFHELCSGDFPYRSFEPIARHTGLDVWRVRTLTRGLARAGLLEYSSGLFNENGDVAGAGYTITAKGRAVARIIRGEDNGT